MTTTTPLIRTERDYQGLADWAEHEMALDPHSPTAEHGEAAARSGQALLLRALGGRPSVDPDAAPGQHARKRQVRLPASVDAELEALAAFQQRKISAVMRDALTDYLRNHRSA